jgi:hypothetical protein
VGEMRRELEVIVQHYRYARASDLRYLWSMIL